MHWISVNYYYEYIDLSITYMYVCIYIKCTYIDIYLAVPYKITNIKPFWKTKMGMIYSLIT